MDQPAPSKYKRWAVGDRHPCHQGYIWIKTPDGNRRHEHRVVYEEALGRPLISDESIHHKNGDRADNRLENLELWYKGQPAGQRVSDLINYVVQHHLKDVLAAIDREVSVCL